MIAWHVGATLFLFRWIFRDPKVDVRFLAVGAVLPDLIDMPLGTLILADRYSSGELWFHSLAVSSLVVVAILLATRRGRRRRAWMALAIGMMLHLLIDGVWTSNGVFAWPFFGLDLPSGPRPYWAGVWDRALSDPWRWIEEMVGIGYLVALSRRARLGDGEVRAEVLRTGRLPV